MRIPIHQVDAFTSRPFVGDPAAVCPLEAWLPDGLMQAIARENGLAKTAFFVGDVDEYEIRWFTPKQEVDLCGHATMAAALVILEEGRSPHTAIRFHSKSGLLRVDREGTLYTLAFPVRAPHACEEPQELREAMDIQPSELLRARDYLAVFEHEDQVRALKVDLARLAGLDAPGVIVTAPGSYGVDFVSRFFAPEVGVDEDPSTGSSHCTLIPYWAARLDKPKLHAIQASLRGGELWCELREPEVLISGHAVKVFEGFLEV